MHVASVSVLALPASRGAALSELSDRSSLAPSAHLMRRGSPRAQLSRIRVDDGWLCAIRQSFILKNRTKVSSVVLMLAYPSQRHIHT